MTEIPPEEYTRILESLVGGIRSLLRLTNTVDLPVCNTRIMREGRGLPWDRRVAVHPTSDGVTNVKAIRIDN